MATELQDLVSLSPDPIIGVNRSGTIILFNAAAERLLGYSSEEVIERLSIACFYPTVERARAIKKQLYASPDRQLEGYETQLVSKRGRVIDIRLSAKLMVRDGEEVGSIGFFHDLTERKQAEAQILEFNATLEQRVFERTAELEASNRELAAFSYSISHDLRAPLRAIHGHSHLLAEEYSSLIDAEGRRHITRISAASKHMGEMIDDLLELGRVTRQNLNRQSVNLGTLAEVILAELRVQAPDRAVTWSIEPDLNVQADPALINILLGNLLRNAWKFTGEQFKAHIEFFATDVDGEKRFCIRDNGAGFDMAYADKLFKPFHRLHDTGRFEGAGIGLTIAQRIVQRHRGHIWAEAEPGKGASLYFTLP